MLPTLVRIQRSSTSASRLRIMDLAGPIEAGAMEMERNPRPINAMASSGRPAISPHNENGRLWRLAAPAMVASALKGAADSAS